MSLLDQLTELIAEDEVLSPKERAFKAQASKMKPTGKGTAKIAVIEYTRSITREEEVEDA